MRAATDRIPRLLLGGSFALSVLALAASWREIPASMAWLLAGALLSLAASAHWVASRSAARAAALRAQGQRLEARLEGFSVAQGRFVRSLAHEIKTPLTIVLNQAELIRRCSDDPAAVVRHADSIADSLQHFSGILDGFLRLGNPRAPADTSQHVPVHLHDLVLEAVQRSQAMAQGCGVGVTTSLAEAGNGDDAPEVMGHAVLLEAMIESLVRHALRFSPPGSCVGLAVEVRGESIELTVRDHGASIAPADLESVLEWFHEGREATRQASGPVVGLAAAKLIAEHHGGAISLRNHQEGGCELAVTLPRLQTGRPQSSAAGELGATPGSLDPSEPGTVAAEGYRP